MSGLRKTMDALAAELEELAKANDAASCRTGLDGHQKCYRSGRSDSYAQAAAKIREALVQS